MLLSIVIPVFNEEESIRSLYEEVVEMATAHSIPIEVIIVNDGSTDKTGLLISSFDGATSLHMRRNYGQSAALSAGIKFAKGEVIAMLDGDGQNDPQNIPMMFDLLQREDVDIVCGWREKRKDPFMKRFISRGAWRLRQLLIKDGIHDSGCTLKVAKASSLKDIQIHGELHRFIPALLTLDGYRCTEVKVNHRSREHGKTKYTWKRIPKAFLDMLSLWFWSRYEIRPMHIFGGLGLAALTLSFITSILGVTLYISGNPIFRNILPIIAVVLFLSGLQFLIFGILADTLSRQSYNISKRDRYKLI